MKKFLSLLLFAVLLAAPASAQVKFGIKGGLDVTHISLSSDVIDSKNREGFFIGPTLKFTLPLVGLGIDAAALYDQRSGKVTTIGEGASQPTTEEVTLTQKQIAIPVNVRYNIGLGSTANVFFFAGPQFGFNVGGDKDAINWKWKDSNFSVNVGLGFTVFSHLQLSANYNIACGKTGEASVQNVAEGVKDFNAKYNAWQIGLAYYF